MNFISKHINYFVTVVQEGSITRAADRLCITPSPLSKRIKELEESLNIALFERTSKGLSLTREGHYLYNDIISHYEGLNRIKNNHKEKRHIQVAIYGATPVHVNTVIDYLLMKDPALCINLNQLTPEELLNRNLLNRLDILFTIDPLLNSPFSQHLCTEDRLLLLHPAGQQPEQYQLLSWVQSTYFSNTSIFKHCYEQLQQQGFSEKLMSVDNMPLRLNIIRQGKAITLVLKSACDVINLTEIECNSTILSHICLMHHIYSNVPQLNNSHRVIAHLSGQNMQRWKEMSG